MIRYLSFEVYVRQIEKRGFVVRDLGLIQSALARPETSLFGEPAYPTIDLKGAALMESLAKNHPLFDGNKRSGWLGLNYFLELNNLEIVATEDEAFTYILDVATSVIDLAQSAAWIEAHRRAI
jgi:death-on-curing protein